MEETRLLSCSADAEVDGVELGVGSGGDEDAYAYQSISAKSESAAGDSEY